MIYRPNKFKALILAVCVAAVLLAGALAFAQSSNGTTMAPKKHTAKKPSSIELQIQQMQQMFQQQQKEIDQLKQQLQNRDQQLQQAQAAAQQSQQAAQQAQSQAQAAQQTSTQNNQAYTNLQQAVQGAQADVAKAKADVTAVRQNDEGMRENYAFPIAMKYKDVFITPGGFLAAETADRQRATGGGLNTPFNSIPFNNSALGKQNEFVATGRQSRITLLAEGIYSNATIGGYYEADFLSAGTTSNSNESNSYTLRQRQMWARYQNVNGLTVVGGQMWSFLTLDTVGMENRYEAIPFTIDPQYVPGFIWTRQYGFRVYQNLFSKKMFAGVALENPQTTFGGQGFSNNFVLGTAGNPGGLLNPLANYSINMAPDVIAKVAFEPGFGHYEIAGIATFLRDRVYPNDATKSASGAYNADKTAGAVMGAAWLPFHKGVYNIGVRGMYGQSVGRYGAGGLPDSTVHPDGTLAPLHNTVALFSAELHPGKWDLYEYYGGDYAGRAAYLNAAGKPVGYGSSLFNNSGCETETVPTSSPYGPGGQANCANDTRAIVNETVGFWYNFYRGGKGKLVYGMQYNNAQRKIWSGIGGVQPKATDNMFWTSFRYYIP
ncbi:MAG: hypothetical protein ACYDC6_10680 [Acidobacteriaceae bacterium]